MMKRLLLAAMLPWLCLAFLQAQQTLPQKLQHFYAPLDKSQAPTGFLYDLSWSFASPSDYRGILTDSNFVSPDVFGMLFGAMRGSMVDSLGLPSPRVFLSKTKPPFSADTIPIAVLALRFNRIRPDAVDNNLLYLDNGQLYDVQGRSQSPYFQDSIFAATVLRPEIDTREVVFQLPSELLFGNFGASPSISIDPGDGQGWRNLSIDQPLVVQYDSDGEKEVVLRLEYPGFTRYSHSRLNILPSEAGERNSGMSWPQDLYESLHITASESYMGDAGGATLHLFYNTHNCNSVKRMIRPLIVVEGYEDGDVSNTFERMFGLLNLPIFGGNPPTENLADYLYPYEYDLIYVDFDDGSDWIQRNAFVVKEVIKKVNEMKAAAGSTEENVIIGVSMGGVVSKYALLDMQANGPDHETRLFFTYDSPLQGANIPIATQCLVKFMVDNLPTYAGDDISVPSIDAIWAGLQAPVPRQLLKYHVNGLATGIDNPEHEAFMTEMNALGALNIRQIALSNGAGTGTFVENNITAGQLFFELYGQKVQCETFGIPILVFPYWIEGVFCGDLNFSIRLRATGNNEMTQVFYGYIEKDRPFANPISTSWSISALTKPYDTSPGGTTNLGVAPLGSGTGGLMTILSSAGVTTSGPGLTATHHCFIPTFSSVNASSPSNFGSPVGCGGVDCCTTASSPVGSPYSGLPEINQAHVFLDERIALVLVDELVTNSPAPTIHPFVNSSVLSTYFNVGLAIYSPIPTVTINTASGKLSINNTGKVAYATGAEPNSPHSLVIADTKCDAVITVENGAKLVVGADGAAKHGVLRVSKGATLHIKSGGILHITSENSGLLIKQGAKLILDPGAIVRLESSGSTIGIQGDLIVNGDIEFSGLGHFNFGAGNRLVFGPGYNTFNLTGAGKTQRFVTVSADVLVEKSHRLNWKNGLLDVNDGDAAIRFSEGAGLNFNNMSITTSTGSGYFAIDAIDAGAIRLTDCTVDKLTEPIVGLRGQGCVITSCEFSQIGAWAAYWTDAFVVRVTNSIFDGSGLTARALFMNDIGFLVMEGNIFSGYVDPSVGGFITDGDLYNATPAVDLNNVVACLVETCFFSGNTIGIKASDPNATANIFAHSGTKFDQNDAAIYVNGNATVGTVLADCVEFDKNAYGIRGRDITLMIDSENTKMFQFDFDQPNRFIRDNLAGTAEDHVNICYQLKGVGGSDLMRNNRWLVQQGNLLFNDFNPAAEILLGNDNCAFLANPKIIPMNMAEVSCLMEQRPESFSNAAPGSECLIGLGGSDNNTNTKVHEQFQLGTFLLKTDSLESGIEALRPVAALWQADLSSFSDNCQQYIRVAKAFIDASDGQIPSLPRPDNERSSKIGQSTLIIVPNPANLFAMVQLSPELNQVRVWDAFGKRYHQGVASHSYRLETASWHAGVYIVETISPDGQRKTGKLVIQR